MINPLLTIGFENEILELIDNQDDYTKSDLKGVVTVLENKIIKKEHEILYESY